MISYTAKFENNQLYLNDTCVLKYNKRKKQLESTEDLKTLLTRDNKSINEALYDVEDYNDYIFHPVDKKIMIPIDVDKELTATVLRSIATFMKYVCGDNFVETYVKKGYSSRVAYLNCLSDEYAVPKKIVYSLSSMLGATEDFDGLITSLEDGDYLLWNEE